MSQLCVLCGKQEATTHDHIPPKSIYPEPCDNDINFHTVPACRDCNEGASVADEEFKVFMTIDTSYQRGNDEQLVDWAAGTVGGNQKIANTIFDSMRRTYAHLGTGVLQPAVCVTFGTQAYIAVIARIVRGLYWTETKKILSPSAKITVRDYRSVDSNLTARFNEALRCGKLCFLNKHTFAYRYVLCDEESSIWGMCFFSSHIAFAQVSGGDGKT